MAVGGSRPRAVPVLARYHQLLLAAAAFAGAGLVTGGTRPGAPERDHPADPRPGRRDRPAPAGHQPAAGHLAALTAPNCIGLAAFMHAAGITCSQRLGDLLATLDPGTEAEAVALLGAGGPVTSPATLTRLEDIIDASGIAPRIEAMLPIGVRHRQLQHPHLTAGHAC